MLSSTTPRSRVDSKPIKVTKVPIPKEVLELENRSIGINGEPTLYAAYKILKQSWDDGDRDREVGLHLLFLSWYGIVEPQHITGFPESVDVMDLGLQTVFSEIHDYYASEIHRDPEMLYVVGLIAHVHGFMFTDPEKWEIIANDYRWRYRTFYPDGIDPKIFVGRGAYGDYFSAQAKVEGGY